MDQQSHAGPSRPPHGQTNYTYIPSAGPSTSTSYSSPSPPAPSGNHGGHSHRPAPGHGQSASVLEPHQDLHTFLEAFWTRQMDDMESGDPDFKVYNLPLARIKKVMKSDEEVKMISAEAPIMFAKACEIFISELTCRAWLVAESHKRRTLQKSDVASAIGNSDMFDFLIDIVPRDDGGAGDAAAPAEVDAEAEAGGEEGRVEEGRVEEGDEGVGSEDGQEGQEGGAPSGPDEDGEDGEGDRLFDEYVRDDDGYR